MVTSTQREALQALCGSNVCFDAPMAGYSSLRAGGKAEVLVDLQDRAQLVSLLQYCHAEGIAWRVIGRGSNILVVDNGFDGVLCRLAGEFATIRRAPEIGPTAIIAGGGCSLTELLGWCMKHGLGGLEFLAGIPGSVGGAVRMNAGAFSGCIGESLQSVSIADPDGSLADKNVESLTLRYRNCGINGYDMERLMILSAGFQLQEADSEKMKEKMHDYLSRRKKNQPLPAPSAGSFFKNPEGHYAGRLIEAAGLKGRRIGGAMVSPVHANFIVNADGTATASDIIHLMQRIQEKVVTETGIFLEPEVHIF